MISQIGISHNGTCRIVNSATIRIAVLIFILALSTPVPVLGIDFGSIFQADYYGLIDPATFYESERIRFTVVPEIAGKSRSNLVHYRLNSVFYFQPIGDAVFINSDRIIREAYTSIYFNNFDLFLGQKFINWGKVDVFSPVNTINHSDNTVLSMDNYLEAALPDLLVQFRVYLSDNFNTELVYVPFLQPNIDPIDEIVVEQQFSISLPTIKTQNFDLNAAFFNRDIGYFDEPAHSIHISANYFSDPFDLSAYYSYYIDQFLDFDIANIEEEIVEDIDSDTHFITGTAYPDYNRVQNVGLGVSFYLMDFLISADGAFKLTQDREGSQMDIKNSLLFYIIQIERVFLRNVHGQLNFFHRYIINPDAKIESTYSPAVEAYIKAVIDDYLLEQPPSQIYVLLHLDTSFFHEKLLPGVNIIYGYSEKAWYYAPRVAYRVSNYITVYAGTDIWKGGIEEGFLGRNNEKDNFFVRLQYEI